MNPRSARQRAQWELWEEAMLRHCAVLSALVELLEMGGEAGLSPRLSADAGELLAREVQQMKRRLRQRPGREGRG